MDNDRLSKWIYASWGIGGPEQYKAFMTVVIQGLARLDCQLIEEDERFLSLTENEQATITTSLELTDRLTRSYLWVLGAYELIRTLAQRAKTESSDISMHMVNRITDTKHSFERIRIPLAKFEASRRNPNDSPIAYPTISPIHGIAWHVNENLYISRRQLADDFLSLMTELRTSKEPNE